VCATPKSINVAFSSWPSTSITLLGLMSRCTTPTPCALLKPRAKRRPS
jgi:hypothetical protein